MKIIPKLILNIKKYKIKTNNSIYFKYENDNIYKYFISFFKINNQFYKLIL